MCLVGDLEGRGLKEREYEVLYLNSALSLLNNCSFKMSSLHTCCSGDVRNGILQLTPARSAVSWTFQLATSLSVEMMVLC